MLTFYFLGGLALILALLVFAGWCIYRAGGENEYERGYGDGLAAKLAEQQQERAEKQAPRHAKSQPRVSTSPAPAAVTPKPNRTQLVRSGYRDSWYAQVAKPAVTAADIAPVVLATPQAAPDLNGADDTGTLLKIGDTGEMKAVTDAWIAEHIHPEVVV